MCEKIKRKCKGLRKILEMEMNFHFKRQQVRTLSSTRCHEAAVAEFIRFSESGKIFLLLFLIPASRWYGGEESGWWETRIHIYISLDKNNWTSGLWWWCSDLVLAAFLPESSDHLLLFLLLLFLPLFPFHHSSCFCFLSSFFWAACVSSAVLSSSFYCY